MLKKKLVKNKDELLSSYIAKIKQGVQKIMKRKSILFVALIAVVAVFVSTNISNAESGFSIGSKLDNFTLPDPNMKNRSFNDLKGKKGAAIIFLSAQCPVVRMYNERINKFANAYKEKGINFIGIYSNRTESLAWVKEHSEANYEFPVLIDKNNVFADKLGATRTPEIYYFNLSNILDYHGAIDNDRSGNNITRQFLTTALNQKLDGKEITQKETRAFGCTIKRVKKAEAE